MSRLPPNCWEELMIRIRRLLSLALSSSSLHWQGLPDDKYPIPLHCLQVFIRTISHRFITVSPWQFKFALAVRSAPGWIQSSANGALQQFNGRESKKEGPPVHPLQEVTANMFSTAWN